jgi:hypothetical protein
MIRSATGSTLQEEEIGMKLLRGAAMAPMYLQGIMVLALLAVLVVGGFFAWRAWASLRNILDPIKSETRGVGVPMVCGEGEDLDGALCYPKCPDGFTGVGPVCWQNCPDGFRDDGAFCAKPEAYGRGAGYALWDEAKCTAENGRCEQNGLLFYPVCREGYQAFGSNICSPICPNGMADMGVSCTKQSQGRTAGVPVHACPAGTEKDETGLLCYPPCPDGYKGVGPVCWEERS